MDTAIAAVRQFSRCYAQVIEALDQRGLGPDATLSEARVLLEVASRAPVTACVLATALGMDEADLGRMLARFEERGWISRAPGEADARGWPVRPTRPGQAVLAAIENRQREALAGLLGSLDRVGRRDLTEALTRARLLLDPASGGEVAIRPFRTGEVAMVAARQSVLYADSHGWGRGLEIVEGEVTAAFLRDFDPAREQCWIAELDGVMAGAVFVTDAGDGVARLRLLHVEPFARRRGIGDALVARCVGFARERDYAAMVLWTHSVLEAARRLYDRHGFRCVETAMHDMFGEPVQGETWRLDLRA